jgi:ribosomal-protein-alanine N-acetyltransferase
VHDGITLRPIGEDELDKVLEVENASFDDPWAEEVFEAELRHSWSQCMVLEEEATSRLLGHVVFWTVADEVHLLNLAVHPDARSRKLGRRLVSHVIQMARENRARFITVEVRASNAVAHGLYESVGFKRVGMRPCYYASDGEDAVIMLYDLGSETGRMATVSS